MSIFVNLLIVIAYKLPHRYFLIVLLSLHWSVLVSCDKQEYGCDGPTYYSISKNLHPLLFEKGSYWIYQNHKENKIDSLRLNDVSVSAFSYPTGHGCSAVQEMYNLSYRSSLYGGYTDSYIGYLIMRGGSEGGCVYLSSFKIDDEVFNARIDTIFESMDVGNSSYNDVVKMYISIDKYIKEELSLYFVDSVGIIRKEIRNGVNVIETFDLIESSVILMQNK